MRKSQLDTETDEKLNVNGVSCDRPVTSRALVLRMTAQRQLGYQTRDKDLLSWIDRSVKQQPTWAFASYPVTASYVTEVLWIKAKSPAKQV